MKALTGVLVVAAMTSMLGCSPSAEAPPPVPEPVPTASAEEKIGDMDFESGEVEEPAATETGTEPEGSTE